MTEPNKHDPLVLDPPPTPEEEAEAKALRDALDRGNGSDDAEFCTDLRALFAPSAIDPHVHERVISKALATATRRPRRVISVAFGTGAALALAASMVLVLTGVLSVPWSHTPPPPTLHTSLIRSRSTTILFDGPFDRHNGNTARIDRIAHARVQDFRSNRFQMLGVR